MKPDKEKIMEAIVETVAKEVALLKRAAFALLPCMARQNLSYSSLPQGLAILPAHMCIVALTCPGLAMLRGHPFFKLQGFTV